MREGMEFCSLASYFDYKLAFKNLIRIDLLDLESLIILKKMMA